MNLCKKCGSEGSVLLRKKDLYCEQCFLLSINHKFRAIIGKNKILSPNENVLICVSGGPGSTALLDFVHNGVSIDNHKKLWITPFMLHITGIEKYANESQVVESIKEQSRYYKFNIHVAHISEYLLINTSTEKTTLQVNSDVKTDFEELLQSMPASSKNDFLIRVTRELFIHYANLFQCKYIFTAETSGTLAINLLSNLSYGRGSQVQHDIGFCDSRDEIRILRPMRDISLEELNYYLKIKHLEVPNKSQQSHIENSIQAVVGKFVTDLQDNFPSTVSTICKTADKIGIIDEAKQRICQLCKSKIGVQANKFSALEATDYSRTVSIGQHSANNENSLNILSMFPHVNKSLCYTCSRSYSEMNQCKLPLHVRENL